MKKNKLTVFFILFPVVAALFFGCGDPEKTEIEVFTEKLGNAVYEQYGIVIPENAAYIGGYYTESFRDSYVVLAFDVPLKNGGTEVGPRLINELFSDGERDVTGDYGWSSGLIEKGEFGREYVNSVEVGELSGIEYSDIFQKEGAPYISVCFVGYRPGKAIKGN